LKLQERGSFRYKNSRSSKGQGKKKKKLKGKGISGGEASIVRSPWKEGRKETEFKKRLQEGSEERGGKDLFCTPER